MPLKDVKCIIQKTLCSIICPSNFANLVELPSTLCVSSCLDRFDTVLCFLVGDHLALLASGQTHIEGRLVLQCWIASQR